MSRVSLRKKIKFSLLAVFVLAALLYPSSTGLKTADAATESNGFIFQNGSIINYTGTAQEVYIPSTIDGQAVKSIDNAFNNNDTITFVSIPEGVTTITNNAFYGCDALVEIQIPSSVFTISPGSLARCKSLANITLSVDNTSFVLENNILYNIDKTEIIQHVPASDTSALIIENTVTTIHNYAFANSLNLTSVQIFPETTYIGTGAFAVCPSLYSVYIHSGNPNYMSVNGVLFSADQKTIWTYPANKSGSSLTIPTGVETLAPEAFSGCHRLETITLSASVKETLYAFLESTSLLNIYADSGSTNFSSASGILMSKDSKTLVKYPAGRTTPNYQVADGITTVGAAAFSYQPYLQSVILPDSLTLIDNFAFMECSALTKMVVPESVESFGIGALALARNLTVWGYPGSPAEDHAKDLNIPFAAMGSSSDWEYTDNPNGTCNITKYIGTDTDVYVPSVIDDFWVYSVERNTFDGCSSIEYLSFYESVEIIEVSDTAGSSYIFDDCTSLREVYLPASLEKFDTNTAPYKPFKGCSALVNIIVDKDNANFYDKDGVLFLADKTLIAYPRGRTSQSYLIPAGTTKISYAAFNNNYLKTVTVPGSVSTLSAGDEATFKNNIETVYLKDGVTTVEDVFSASSPMNIHFPAAVTEVTGFAPSDIHTFYVYEDSVAHVYAAENNINYVFLCLVEFNSNGGINAPTQVVVAGSKVTEPTGVTKPNNVLIGWYRDIALTDKWEFGQDTAAVSMTLNAKWVEGYPIIYHMNTGINNPTNPVYYVAGTTVFLEDPTNPGFTFDGWYTDSSCALQYKFEAIESDTTGPVELWADWWIATTPSGSSGSSGSSNLSDERKPEISQIDFPEQISYMQEGQQITVKGKLYIKYANVEDITATYSGRSEKIYKYVSGAKRLTSYNFSHTFTVGEIGYYSTDNYVITIRLATGELYGYHIPIYKYTLETEILGAPYGNTYLSSDKTYKMRSMAIASNAFSMLKSSYKSLTPEIGDVTKDGVFIPLAAGTATVETTIILDGSILKYQNEFTVVEKRISEPDISQREFMCSCHGKYCAGLPDEGIDPALLDLVDKIREEAGVPVYVVTGYRCSEYNKSIGANPTSEHINGTGADLWAKDLTIDELYEICDSLNIAGGVGKYDTYVHVDVRAAYIRWED